ncbi:MAG TPA: hypothetical protein VGM56_18875, partial [Byssovorax sp.]
MCEDALVYPSLDVAHADGEHGRGLRRARRPAALEERAGRVRSQRVAHAGRGTALRVRRDRPADGLDDGGAHRDRAQGDGRRVKAERQGARAPAEDLVTGEGLAERAGAGRDRRVGERLRAAADRERRRRRAILAERRGDARAQVRGGVLFVHTCAHAAEN